jgi:hypothetical protein
MDAMARYDECIGSDESLSRKIHVLLEKELLHIIFQHISCDDDVFVDFVVHSSNLPTRCCH